MEFGYTLEVRGCGRLLFRVPQSGWTMHFGAKLSPLKSAFAQTNPAI